MRHIRLPAEPEVSAEPAATPAPPSCALTQPGGEAPAGFRLARIADPRELEAGAYWPQLLPHFRDPTFRHLRYRIEARAGAATRPEGLASIRGASSVGELDIAYIADRLAATLTVTESGIPGHCLTLVRRGALQCTGVRGGARQVGPATGLIYRGQPGTTLAAAGSHERLAVWIPAESLDRRLSALLGGPVGADLAFQPVFDWNAAPAQALWRQLRLMVEELGAPAPFAGSDLARRAFVDVLLHTLLQAVPHSHTERLARPERAAVPGIVRRAEAFMRAHLEEPVALHDVAAAAGCSIRSLQLGFQRFRGTTPHAALQQARLEAARQAFRSGPPEGTVTAVTLRFGFSNPGRFAKLYNAASGESPRDALRGDRSGSGR